MALRSLLQTVLLLAAGAAASELTSDVAKAQIPGILIAEGSMTEVSVVLNSGAYSAIPRQDGSFVFHEVPEGSFLLEVYDTQRSWPSVRVEVGRALYGGASAVLVHNRQQLQMPMQLKPVLAKPEFFEKRQGFQWSSIFMNPMMIMMAVTGVIMFVMPKMMANMDPEDMKKMQEMQAAQGSLSFSDLLNPEKLKEKQAQLQLEQKKSKKAK